MKSKILKKNSTVYNMKAFEYKDLSIIKEISEVADSHVEDGIGRIIQSEEGISSDNNVLDADKNLYYKKSFAEDSADHLESAVKEERDVRKGNYEEPGETIIDSGDESKLIGEDEQKSQEDYVGLPEFDNGKKEEPEEEIVPLLKHREILEAEKNKCEKIGYDKGYNKGLEEAKSKFQKDYSAQKEDYIELLNGAYSDAINELGRVREAIYEIDSSIPKIITNFVRRIIGFERKINDKIIISVIKNKMNKIKNLEDIQFLVHPKDLDIVKFEYPGYPVEKDSSVTQGSFKIKTKIGDVDFNIDSMMGDLEKIIDEELKAAATT